MSLFLDSASLEELRRAKSLGLIRGVTTNPSLLAAAGRPALEVARSFLSEAVGPIFVQLAGNTIEEREREAEVLVALDQEQGRMDRRVGLKIPATLENFALAARLVKKYGAYQERGSGVLIGITALFDPAQVYLAGEVGARYVFPYVNRSTRLLGDGNALVAQMRAVLHALRSPVEIVAASLKSPAEAIAATLAGAQHLTVPLALLEAMGHHPLSEETIAGFASS